MLDEIKTYYTMLIIYWTAIITALILMAKLTLERRELQPHSVSGRQNNPFTRNHIMFPI